MPDAPFAGPFYGPTDPQGRGPDKSPYIRGWKRGLSRWDDAVLPWDQFDDHFNKKTEAATAVFQEAHGIEATGQIGRPTHEAMERSYRNRNRDRKLEPALDAVAVMLMEDGYDLKHPPVSDVDKARQQITAYLLSCELNKQKIHYRQQRPMRSLGISPGVGYYGDCSELVVATYYWARAHTGIHVPDPSGYGYEGYGNTVTIYTTNRYRKVPTFGTFQVGDCALYGAFASKHTTICRQGGTAATAVFTSHGSESGPVPTRLHYRPDLFCIVRPRIVP